MRRERSRSTFGDVDEARRHFIRLLSRRVDPVSALSSVRFRFGMVCSRIIEQELGSAFLQTHGDRQSEPPMAV